jgi:hypothetical protein
MLGTQDIQDLFSSRAINVPASIPLGSYADTAGLPTTSSAEGSVHIARLHSLVGSGTNARASVTSQDQDEDLRIQLLDLGLCLTPQLDQFDFLPDDGIVTFVANVEGAAEISATLRGELVADGAEFNTREVSLRIVPLGHLARADFLASSLTASLALGGRMGIRIVGDEIKFREFELPLAQITSHLRMRETARRLMIIGKATGTEFNFPERLSGAEIQEIAFTHHAVVDREFVWPMSKHGLPIIADRENLQKLDATTGPQQIGIPRHVVFDLLGHQIRLGAAMIILQEAVIEDFPQVRQLIALLDGALVSASVRSLVGRAIIQCPEAPSLPSQPWTRVEEVFMALDPELCRRLADRYNSLAAETLSGLADSDKQQLTHPKPKLNSLLERKR